MKFKFIITILFSSLLLNIFHDLLITHHTPVDVSKIVMIDDDPIDEPIEEHKMHMLCDLHKMFHFSAILFYDAGIEQTSKVSSALIFIEKISPQQLIESSFKPPKA